METRMIFSRGRNFVDYGDYSKCIFLVLFVPMSSNHI